MFQVGKGILMLTFGWGLLSPIGSIYGLTGWVITLAHVIAICGLCSMFFVAANIYPPPSGLQHDSNQEESEEEKES